MPDRDPNLRKTERSLPIALLRAREVVMTPIREMLAHSGINEQKWRVLRVVEEQGPIEQTAIAAAACLLLPSLTRILRTMEEEGLLSRQTDPADRRRTLVSVTEQGRGLINAHAAESAQILNRLEERFGKDRLNNLLDLLDALRQLDN